MSDLQFSSSVVASLWLAFFVVRGVVRAIRRNPPHLRGRKAVECGWGRTRQ